MHQTSCLAFLCGLYKLFALFLVLCATVARASAREQLKVCRKCSIYVLDLKEYAGQPCNLSKNALVNPKNGVVYQEGEHPGLYGLPMVSHQFGTHSAPFHLSQTIRNSSCHTDDMDSASLIFVDDYCYYISWLADVHSFGRTNYETSGDYLIEGWQKIKQLQRWQRNNGADFVFYDPHPGFVSGRAEAMFEEMKCNDFKASTHILVERGQRNTCPAYHEMKKQIITPYVPNTIDVNNTEAVYERRSIPRAERNMTIYFSSTCSSDYDGNVGKVMRLEVVKALNSSGPDVDVSCLQGGMYLEFEAMLSQMEHTVFCIVVPGDAQSTRRLTEIFMAGCIPVFIGPPYNSMPLADEVNWPGVGVFFNVTNYSPWMLDETAEWSVEGPQRANWPGEARWWMPDADISEVVINIENMADVLGHLRYMPETEISYKLRLMEKERFRFTFAERLPERPNAVSSIIHQMCKQTLGS